MLKKKLMRDLDDINKSNLSKLNVDTKSYSAGYSNGFVRGFYHAIPLVIIISMITVMVAVSIIFYNK